MNSQHQPQPSPSRQNPLSTLNTKWVINGAATLVVTLVALTVLRPQQKPVEQAVRPTQQPAPVQQVAPAATPAPTYQALQISQTPAAVDPIEAEYRRLAELMVFNRPQFDAIVTQYQSWVSYRTAGDATAIGIIRLIDEGALPVPYPMIQK